VALCTWYPATPEEELAVHLRVTEWATLATPAPPTVIVVGEFAALLVSLTLPLSVSVFVGAKVTSKVAVWPGAIVAPFTPPLVLISVAETPIPETVMLELPVFSIFTGNVSVFPMATLPKLRVAGTVEIVRAALTPFAVIGTVTLPPGVAENTTLPAAEPAVIAEKLNVQFASCPAPRVTG
jgi:hypothetical protein